MSEWQSNDDAVEGTQEVIFGTTTSFADDLTDPELVELVDLPLVERAERLEGIHQDLRERLARA